MPHCDPDDLALRALGEPAGTAADDTHLAGCPQCQLDLEELRDVVRAGRGITAQDSLSTPPDRVWEQIAGELGLRRHDAEPAEPARHLSALSPPRGKSADASTPPTNTAPTETAPTKRRWRGMAALTAAAATTGILVGLGLGALRASSPDVVESPGQPGRGEPTVQAQVSLRPLGDIRARGSAVLTEESGLRSIEVDITGLPAAAAGAYYEVWLIDRGVTRLVSLGPLDTARTTFPVPAGLDLTAFPVLDVSVETFDGDPGHSSDSLVRGVLPV